MWLTIEKTQIFESTNVYLDMIQNSSASMKQLRFPDCEIIVVLVH